MSQSNNEPSPYHHLILTTPIPHVALLTISRPSKLNAFHHALWLEFGRAFRELSHDPTVRVVVLAAEGERAFTAGLDVKEAVGDGAGGFVKEGGNGKGGEDAARWAWVMRRKIEVYQGCVGAMEECEKPVIVAMHGLCLGLGIDIACCADIRLCASSTTFSVKEVDIGMAADVGTLARLPKIVGSHSWVKDVCLTARDFSASEALTQGFVSKVVEGGREGVLKEAMGMAEVLAGKSPVAVQGTKELLRVGREMSVQGALRYTAVWNSVALAGGDMGEAMGARAGRRKARFENL